MKYQIIRLVAFEPISISGVLAIQNYVQYSKWGKKSLINKSSYIGETLERQKRFDFHNYHSMLCVSINVSLISLEAQLF